jgi:hypothetical protein
LGHTPNGWPTEILAYLDTPGKAGAVSLFVVDGGLDHLPGDLAVMEHIGNRSLRHGPRLPSPSSPVCSAEGRRDDPTDDPPATRHWRGRRGDLLVEDGKVVLTPAAVVPRNQMWFWTPEWQAREAEADADLAVGSSTTYDSDEEFLQRSRLPDADV